MRVSMKFSIAFALLLIPYITMAGWVRGYTRKDGTKVSGYYRRDPGTASKSSSVDDDHPTSSPDNTTTYNTQQEVTPATTVNNSDSTPLEFIYISRPEKSDNGLNQIKTRYKIKNSSGEYEVIEKNVIVDEEGNVIKQENVSRISQTEPMGNSSNGDHRIYKWRDSEGRMHASNIKPNDKDITFIN